MRTEKEWDEIFFKRNLSPQIGGLLHDAVNLVIAFNAGEEQPSKRKITKEIKKWVDILYDLAEKKKKKILEVDIEKANELWDEKKQEIYNQDAELEEINKELAEASELEKNF